LGLGVRVALLKEIDVSPGVAVSEAEAPQPTRGFAGPGGLAIIRLAGKSSVRETCVKEALESLLFIDMSKRLTSPTNIVLGEKDLFTDGVTTPRTVKVALAGVVFVIETFPPVELNSFAGMVLIRFPGVVDVTSIPTVHCPGVIPTCWGTVPPFNASVVVPGLAVMLPLHVLETLAGEAINNPGCTPTRSSIQEALSNWNEFGLYIVTSRRDIPPDGIAIGVKLLLISAGKDNPWA
jgi:hypothetical protein